MSLKTLHRAPLKKVEFCATNITSQFASDPFCLFYVTSLSTPRQHIIINTGVSNEFRFNSTPKSLGFVCMMFCTFQNTEGKKVTQYVGASLIDLSQSKKMVYRLDMKDSSVRPPIVNGHVSIKFTEIPTIPENLRFQSNGIVHKMFDAAESNLQWISPFNTRGLPPIEKGLQMVHSPYYVNFMGITLPSGAFCLINTEEHAKKKALQSHYERLSISLARGQLSEQYFIKNIQNLMKGKIKSKHLRCLNVISDALTCHARMDIEYSPDVVMGSKIEGTERWDVPREPTRDGKLSFTGDCEDFAREVYQQAKEIRQWVKPSVDKGILEAMSAVLHMYVPTIEQGAVNSNAVSEYQKKKVPVALFRNHIWAALHPRHAWKTKCSPPSTLEFLYAKWPYKPCEPALPMMHLEGTGDVLSIVTSENAGYIQKIHTKKLQLVNTYPHLATLSSHDMSLQFQHRSNFYKVAVACMTDIFAEKGVLDFTYVSNKKYGVNIYDWTRGKYRFRPSTKHSKQTMENIIATISLERPIQPILTRTKILETSVSNGSDSVRFGSKFPIRIPKGAKNATYQIGPTTWYEIYFSVGSNSVSSESDSGGLLLI
jgi:hypothetical protein